MSARPNVPSRGSTSSSGSGSESAPLARTNTNTTTAGAAGPSGYHAGTPNSPTLLSPTGGSFDGSALFGSKRASATYFSPASNTVGYDTTSAAIARGEIGANYSRYSAGNLASLTSSPASSANPLGAVVSNASRPSSSARLSALMSPHRQDDTEDIQNGVDLMPLVSPGNGAGAGQRASRFSEYGMADGIGSAESFRDSAIFDSSPGTRESMQYYRDKEFEDTSLLWNEKNVESDDFLHDPRTLSIGKSDRFWNFPTSGRGFANALGITVLIGGFIALFLGWPIHTVILQQSSPGWGWGLGATNSSGQIPDIPNLPSLIDADTPDDVKNSIRTGFNGKQYQLVFSDEFNRDGRTFFPGDDPYWEAVDIHYWQTDNLEWYDPDAATTANGTLQITLSEQPIHGLNFRSAMLQSWNKLCFNGGAYFEISISLPGNAQSSGFWPGAWTMGNLGRAGYGATNDGMWPYSYGSCDVGTLPGQMFPNNTPVAAFSGSGSTAYNGRLSILDGQRASACTCKGEIHPGPSNNVGRGAPEIDIIEAEVDWRGFGDASQSVQIAPFDDQWNWNNLTSAGLEVYNNSKTTLNAWKGAATQMSCSAVTELDAVSYGGAQYQSFGYELVPGGSSDSQITWAVGGNPTWTLKSGAFPPNPVVDVGQRLISEEPMYMIINLGLSSQFQSLQFNTLQFPGIMYIDYVRVWQEKGQTDISCDPPDHPTADYINRYMQYYTDFNITTWPTDLWPKNSLTDNC